jgi:hypothetical protein
MKKLFCKKYFAALILAAMMVITLNSCKEDDKDEIPALPPLETLLMDFSLFDDGIPQEKKAVLSYQNFGYAVMNVATWNAAATLAVVLPVAAYAEAFNHDPVYLGDNSWQWSYSVTVNQATYTARLTSQRISNEEFTLKMVVSKSGTGGFQDFTWFEGTVRYDHTSATWNLYESPSVTYPVLNVLWTKDFETDLYTIKYTCTRPESDLFGGYIEHGITDDADFDAYYTITFPAATINIEWNKTTHEGRIKAPGYFQDENWHCWDANLADVACEDLSW